MIETGRGVLVLTQSFDPHADLVISELDRMGAQNWRVDTSDFPLNMTFSALNRQNGWDAWLEWSGCDLNLAEVGTIWFRRPTRFKVNPALEGSQREFALGECRMAMGGVLRALPARWVNHPEAIVSADYKPYQLATASRLGFEVPASLVTNDPAKARDFVRNVGRAIYKPLSAVVVGADEDRPLVQFTRDVDVHNEEALDAVGQAPCLFQERVEKAHDLRVVVIGRHLFAVEIHARGDETSLDWRRNYDELSYAPHSPAPELRDLCLLLVHELRLVFGVIDLAVRPDGTVLFFEINTNGQWAWLEEAIPEMAMVRTMARFLVGRSADP